MAFFLSSPNNTPPYACCLLNEGPHEGELFEITFGGKEEANRKPVYKTHVCSRHLPFFSFNKNSDTLLKING